VTDLIHKLRPYFQSEKFGKERKVSRGDVQRPIVGSQKKLKKRESRRLIWYKGQFGCLHLNLDREEKDPYSGQRYNDPTHTSGGGNCYALGKSGDPQNLLGKGKVRHKTKKENIKERKEYIGSDPQWHSTHGRVEKKKNKNLHRRKGRAFIVIATSVGRS